MAATSKPHLVKPDPSKRIKGFPSTERIQYEMAKCIREAMIVHKALGQSICGTRDGELVDVAAEDIVIRDLPPEPKDD